MTDAPLSPSSSADPIGAKTPGASGDSPATPPPSPLPSDELSAEVPVDTMIPAPRRKMFGGLVAACAVRPLGWVAAVGVIVGLLLPATGLGPSTCGMQRSLAVPCPGCGLTRSVSSFLQGQFSWSFQFHPMGWAFAVAMLILAVGSFLPSRWRDPVIARLSKYDGPIGFGLIAFAVLLVGYGIYRIVMVQSGVDGFAWWSGDGSNPPPFVPTGTE